MIKSLIKIAFLVSCLFQISCGTDCSEVVCESPHGILRVKAVTNGKNALFGRGHEFPREYVRLFTPITDTSSYDFDLIYNENAEVIEMDLTEGIKYHLDFFGVRQDVFEISSVLVSEDDCCKIYKLESAKQNGKIICTDGCNGVIELQL